MIFFTITGILFWVLALLLVFAIIYPFIPASVRNFFPDLWFILTCLWCEPYDKQGGLNLLISKREGKTNWAMRVSRWILKKRTR